MPDHAEFQSVKEARVHHIFNTIAAKYDYTNALMSFGIHQHWQKKLLQTVGPLQGKVALDLCCGTGKVTLDLARMAGSKGTVIGVDFSESMLEIAWDRLESSRFKNRIQLVKANARELPFPDNTFDCITIAYGLRNVSDPARVLLEMQRVTKPGGRVASLEMTKPDLPVIKELYEFYLNHWIPFLGGIVADNRPAYQYLHDSINQFLHPHRMTCMLYELGFNHIICLPLSLGIATIHSGQKPF